MQVGRQAYIHTGKQAGRQAVTGEQPDIHTYRQGNKHTGRKSFRQAIIQTGNHIVRLAVIVLKEGLIVHERHLALFCWARPITLYFTYFTF